MNREEMYKHLFYGIWDEEDIDCDEELQAKRVIYQGTHTIVIWNDDTKTVVNCYDENFDKEKGLAMAIVKKIMSRAKFNSLIDNAVVKE